MLSAQNLLITALVTLTAPPLHATGGATESPFLSSQPVLMEVAPSQATKAESSAESESERDSAFTDGAEPVQSRLPEGSPVPALSGSDRKRAEQCLALNIYHEARSESVAGQNAVAAVTLNRVASKSFPNSVCKVVKQGGKRRNKCQFSWWCDNKSDKPQEQGAWERALELSRKALKGKIPDPTNGALFYHAKYVKPRWSRTFKRTSRIGQHVFYKPRGA